MKKALIAGAGYLGLHLSEILLENNWKVHTVSRSKKNLNSLVTQHNFDLTDDSSLSKLEASLKKENFDFVYFFASPDGRNKDAYKNIFGKGLSNLLQLDIYKNTARFFFSSSTAVYAQNDGSVVNEESTVCSKKFNAEALLEAEDILRKSNLSTTSLRLSGLYGPGRKRLIDKASSIKSASEIENPFSYTNRIHVEDAARASFHLSNIKETESLYVVSDEHPALRADVMNHFRSELSLTPLDFESQRPDEEELHGKQASSNKLKNSGFKFNFPSFREGYEKELAN